MIQIRRQHPVFRRRRFFQGRPIRGSGVKDIAWLTPEGARDERQRMGPGLRPFSGRVSRR